MVSEYYCYLISAANKKTYIGITNNLKMRIKKHNKLYKGGAKSTRMSNNWKYELLSESWIAIHK